MLSEDWQMILARDSNAPWHTTSVLAPGRQEPTRRGAPKPATTKQGASSPGASEPEDLWACRRGPAQASRLARFCERLGIAALPPSFDAFLRLHDGGWIGDRYGYGLPELELIADFLDIHPKGRRGQRLLLPFHPVDRFGVESLDLSAPQSDGECPVVWCRDTTRRRPIRHDVIHPLAEVVVRGEPCELIERTYVDFTDWALDALDEARLGTARLVSSEPS